MQYANSLNGSKILATPEAKGAICPACGASVRAKCGNRNVWHWAHINTEDCDTWSESEGEWHVGWKEIFPQEWREVVIGEHRADIQTGGGLVVELQHSPITPEVVKEREHFYKNMIWIFNATEYAERCRLICWFGEHPHPIYPYGHPNDAFCLNNLEEVLEAHAHFLASDGRPEELVDFNEISPYERELGFREKAIQKSKTYIKLAENKIAEWQEKRENPRAAKHLENWQSKLTQEQEKLKRREQTRFLRKPYPAMDALQEHIQLFDSLIPTWRIKFKWSQPRSGNLACDKPVFWDVGSEQHLIFFPEGTSECHSSALVMDKEVVLDAVRKSIV
ncbi:competence protein CoiA [Leptothoe sp. PORK10 BA2]|uniref:competence protein CoiA n=1 Tax=Leptothoe sp. PORK10 BA2 TaxID=3110254 RepID=UPI002B2083BB|nr:competence protein CoiA family protein [Leptothoe sp. PORK10 BA2]MEA5464935.1 competence protein CoiA family protein [Leptothoe sp. PORK10 BA2]